MTSPLKIIIMISGSGTNLRELIRAIEEKRLNASIAAVVCDNTNAAGLAYAATAQIPTHLITKQNFPQPNLFFQEIKSILLNHNPDLIVLAGFMKILPEFIIREFYGKIINIHPSLLPKYPGLHTHARALAAHEKFHGSTVHFVTEVLDAGPIIAQTKLQINDNETVLSLEQRIKNLEYQLYPTVVQWFAEGRVQLKNNRVYIAKNDT